MQDILKYDVMETNMLYDGDVMAKHELSKLLERYKISSLNNLFCMIWVE